MAKGNLFQGMGRGKVGDVVFSRLNGQQISRVRNRNPKNPRTNAQLYQRAVMATVMQAYSAGREIFDHAFQGKEVGAGNQRVFMSLNARKIREGLADNIETYGNRNPRYQTYSVVAPATPGAVPNQYVVSQGSLVNTVLGGGGFFASKLQDETLAAYCQRLGLTANDLYTFVAFLSTDQVLFTLDGITTTNDEHYHQQMSCEFKFARFKVKSSAFASNETTFTFGDVFEMTESNFTPLTAASNIAPGTPIKISNFCSSSNFGSFAWIRSRVGEDLRSSETMTVEQSTEDDYTSWGIRAMYALDAWKQGTPNLGDSDLILEGGDL